MAKYVLVYHGGNMPETEEEGAAVTGAWNEWLGALGPAIVDLGNPTGAAKTVAPGGAVSDGGEANPASGYSVISANDLDAAVEAAKGCPVLLGGGSVKVAETFDVM